MAGIKIASNVLSNVLDHSCELYSVLVVEKFWQRHGDLIVSGDSVFVLGQTWLVAMVPMEYTNQVLFPMLKIFSLVVAIRNLQLFLMRVELPK